MPCVLSDSCVGCALGSHGVALHTGVKQTVRNAPVLRVVIDHPSQQDKDNGYLLSDMAGTALQTALDRLGIPRDRVSVVSVLPCAVPGDSLDDFGRNLRKTRRVGGVAGENPALCGAKVYTGEENCPTILCGPLAYAWGKPVAEAGSGVGMTADEARGTVWESKGAGLGGWRGVSYSLGRVASEMTLMPVLVSDIGKLVRWAQGRERWSAGEFSSLNPTDDEIKAGLRRLWRWAKAGAEGENRAVAYDTEADSKYALYAELRCFTLSNGEYTLVVPMISVHGEKYPNWEARKEWVTAFFREISVFGHNAGNYDALLVEQTLGITPKLVADTILLDQLSDNNLPHRLGFAVSYRLDAPDAWKADHTATTARGDGELYNYALKDAHRTFMLRAELERTVDQRGQRELVSRELGLQLIGKKMTRLGLKVNLGAAEVRRDEVRAKLAGLESDIRSLLGGRGAGRGGKPLNIASSQQLGKLLYDDWNLAIPEYSEITGEPSVNDSAMRKMLIEWVLTDEQREFIGLVRRAKSEQKLLGTYLEPLIPWGKTYGETERTGIIGPDGRVHPSYSRLPSSGRYSSQEPNGQNIDNETRELYVPEDENVYVGCDSKALELACIGEAAGAAHIIEWFNTPGLCPHNETMEGVYGPGIWKLPGAPKARGKKGDPGSVFYNTRGLIKNVRYAYIYAAGAPTVWQQVTAAEDAKRNLLYAAVTLPQVRDILEKLKKLDPEIPEWWESQKRAIRRRGYVEDPLWGRRRYLPEGGSLSEIVNHPIQAMGFVIVAEAMFELMHGKQPWFSTETAGVRPDFDSELFRFRFSNRTGQVTNTHDSLVWEVPRERESEALAGLVWAMTRRTKKFGKLTYDAEGKGGRTWAAV